MKLWLVSGPLEVSDFSASDTLARSLWLGNEPSVRSARYLEKALVDPIRALRIPFSASMYREGDSVYIGRGLPLSVEQDVIEVVEHCSINPSSGLVKSAVDEWHDRAAGTQPTNSQTLLDKAAFDTFLRNKRLDADPDYEKLKKIESQILDWFRPRHNLGPQASSPNFVKAYSNLPGELQIVVLLLAYRLGFKHQDGLQALIKTRDWHYLSAVISKPQRESREPERAAVQQIRACLSPEALKFALDNLWAQPMVGHRALATEYERISGFSHCKYPTDHIQDKMLRHIDSQGEGLNAICLSGGGIRSASFCLGALQVLASHGLFGRFHYISTVSGGGYIGTALTRWMSAKQRDDGLTAEAALRFAEDELANLRSVDYVKNRMLGTDFEEEGPLTWLRMNSNYLARRLALFSADAWTIVAVYLRNLFIVWIMFWPWISGFLLLPWFAVWLGQYKHFHFWICPEFWGGLGATAGVFGATYFYQGNLPNQPERRYANLIRVPKGGDKRAWFGAFMLLIGCFMVSCVMWSDADRHPKEKDFLELALDNSYLVVTICVTQIVLAWKNRDPNNPLKTAIMLFSAIPSSATQSLLIISIRMGLYDWPLLHAGDKPGPNTMSLETTVRALITPLMMLVALLIGEGIKAAVRSLVEGPGRREHQGRAHAFVFMLLVSWAVSAILVIGVPAYLTFAGGSVPGVTAAGSAFSLAVSTYLGYRKSSPGKPDAQSSVSFTLLGSVGIVLLALLVSIGSWKVLEQVAIPGQVQSLVRCKCINMDAGMNVFFDNSKVPTDSFRIPNEESLCTVSTFQCVDRSFTDFFNEFIARFNTDRLGFGLLILAASCVVSFFLGFIIRMNEFSLHGFYRDRLIRGFYGGFRGVRKPRKPTRFTGFDPADDIAFASARSLYPRTGKFVNGNDVAMPPFLVVNAALNLVKGTALAWQERKADSFTFTALAAGNYRLGFRSIRQFAGHNYMLGFGRFREVSERLKLGTAMAISGAAFNPNMGYNSSTPMAFLMSVFNVRLGWWLGNPKRKTWTARDPSSSSWRLLQEAAGQTTDDKDWIHLSDGGHFDNMGLWEMVHRRCRRILVIDASQDGRFSMEDFYSTIRKIRIDMGIEINSNDEPVMLYPRSARASGMYYARFKIHYLGVNGGPPDPALSGTLIYLKPCVYGKEPPDIQQYAERHPEFPHESTADQFFNESQFESYRKLGEWEMTALLKDTLGGYPPNPGSAPGLINDLFA